MMESGVIPVDSLSGGVDLQSTLESGQTYLWGRLDGKMYEATTAYGGSSWYYLAIDGDMILVRQRENCLEWKGPGNAEDQLRRFLRLDDDLEKIFAETPTDPLFSAAFEKYRGMRIVRDPFFPCLISFICSSQMRVERIYQMQQALSRAYGEPVNLDGEVFYTFPSPAALAGTSEEELRDLGLGYRAPYVVRTAQQIDSGELTKKDISGPYEKVREELTGFMGVGHKVADCVCLFSLGYLEAIPLDTWIRTAIEEYYPYCDQGSYIETSRALRAEFGAYPGYVQTYIFHYLRTTNQ